MIALILMAIALGCGGDDGARVAAIDGGGPSDAPTRDAGSDAAAHDAAGDAEDIPTDAGRADTGPPCRSDCVLYDRDSCGDTTQSCRLSGCSARCGPVVTPTRYAQPCEDSTDCPRGMQCLAPETLGSGACFAYCALGPDGDAFCDDLRGGALCIPRTDLRDIDDDVAVVLPPGVGACR